MQPKRLGTYQILRELGRGGMGVVYEARHAQSGQPVAIKVLSAQVASEPGFAERFEREVAVLQKLSHPNIVRLIDHGHDNGLRYYVMEFIQGRSLEQEIAEAKRIDWRRTIKLAVQMCAGLKHAHDHGIIHRDLKPANLLVTAEEVVKLTDFGIARVFATTRLTATGSIIGTAEYMSPEQGAGKQATRRSDLYSLGVVLYAMLTGRPPFTGKSPAELLQMHRYGRFDPPQALVPDIPPWLNELVCQLLEKDPERRPPDAYVVRRRLESIEKKVQLKSSESAAGLAATVAVDQQSDRRRGPGPATLMQRLVRAQLERSRKPGWVGALFQKTWFLVLALLLTVTAITVLSVRSGESRRWKKIERLWATGNDQDLGLLEASMQEYLRRYPDGEHADQVRRLIPDVQRARRRRLFLRSPLVGHLRPGPRPPSPLERLYRKALLQLWTEGEQQARSTLEQVVAMEESAGDELYLVQLAREDLAALDLHRAARLAAAGQTEQARTVWQRVIDRYANSPGFEPLVRAARQALAQAPAEP